MTSESTPDLDVATLAELHRLARSRPRNGRGQVAKLGAIRTLERLGRGGKATLPMPVGWHPGPPEFEALDAIDPPELRERWWASLYEGKRR